MEQEILRNFMEHTLKDPRIDKAHIAIFTALFYLWTIQQFPKVIKLFSYEIMRVAKISSSATYHRLLKDLCAFGYLKYEPSRFRKRPSEYSLIVGLKA